MSNRIEAILNQGRQEAAEPETDESQFFKTTRIGGEKEDFLEVRFNNGVVTLLKYDEASWFNYDPETGWLVGNFVTVSLSIKGRGLVPDVMQAIKSRKLAWLREADTDFQDRPEFKVYIEEITIEPVDEYFGVDEKPENE